MKTTFKTMTSQKKAGQKRKEFQAKTGLKWDWYSTGMGIRFTPIVTKETPMDKAAAAALLPYLTSNYQEFVKLAEISGIPLANILIGAKTLAKEGEVMPTVNRAGGFFAIRAKHSWEV